MEFIQGASLDTLDQRFPYKESPSNRAKTFARFARSSADGVLDLGPPGLVLEPLIQGSPLKEKLAIFISQGFIRISYIEHFFQSVEFSSLSKTVS